MILSEAKKYLNKFPVFKSLLRAILLIANYKKDKCIINNNLELNEVYYNKDTHNFFGYYNLPCINEKDYILFHSAKSNLVRPGLKNDPSDICIKHCNDEKARKIGETFSWNWQQGSMLQWIPNHDNLIIYNNFRDKKYFAEIINISGKKIFETNYPVYSVTKDGSFSYSINFNRLQKFRPDYAYFNKLDNVYNDQEDGIFKIDLKSGNYSLVLPLSRIIEINSPKYFRTSSNWFNHLDVNSNGDLMFFHRYYFNNKIYTRLFIYKTKSDQVEFIHESKFISHCAWYDDKIVSWCSINEREEAFNILRNEDNYEYIGKKVLNSDGHPTMFLNNRYLLSDTYPGKSRHAELYIFDNNINEKISLGKFYQPLKYINEFRCDLHPRISENLKVSFDSTHTGKRRLYWMDLNNLVKNNE
jgi:hypothetical protein